MNPFPKTLARTDMKGRRDFLKGAVGLAGATAWGKVKESKASSNSSGRGKVMTVLGPISADDLGITLMHEHMACAYPGWYADESKAPYDRDSLEERCLKILRDLKAVGVKTIVDATPNDLGRLDPKLLQTLSRKSGINIIMSTGLYYEAQGAPHYWNFRKWMGADIENEIFELFKEELTQSVGKTGVRAGVIKVGSSDLKITDYEQTVFRAAVKASRETGVPIITHAQGGTIGPAQQDLFIQAGGNPHRIMIGHQNNTADITYHLSELQNPGFYLGFDRTGLGLPTCDPKAEEIIIELIKKGYANRIMLSHDTVGVWLGRPIPLPDAVKESVKNWYPTYIHTVFVPKMKAAGVTDEQINMMFIDNPKRFFA
jgi:phosphotriesterase-related protein